MTDLKAFSTVVADLVLEAPDLSTRKERARELLAQATAMVMLLEGSRETSERAYRIADHLAGDWH